MQQLSQILSPGLLNVRHRESGEMGGSGRLGYQASLRISKDTVEEQSHIEGSSKQGAEPGAIVHFLPR